MNEIKTQKHRSFRLFIDDVDFMIIIIECSLYGSIFASYLFGQVSVCCAVGKLGVQRTLYTCWERRQTQHVPLGNISLFIGNCSPSSHHFPFLIFYNSSSTGWTALNSCQLLAFDCFSVAQAFWQMITSAFDLLDNIFNTQMIHCWMDLLVVLNRQDKFEMCCQGHGRALAK